MSRFDKIKYEESESGNLLHVGAGCLWGAVYRKAARHSVGVVGGVEPGVGVGGLLLGGGYSLKSSRLGLGIDNIQAFRIVTPKGLILEVSDKSTGEDKELFNALRVCLLHCFDVFFRLPFYYEYSQGGANNFGIVTRFTLKTHPQTMTYVRLIN
jgi:FAD/FMN-containing dehydrogenase